MHVSNYKATFSPVHLISLELDARWQHLDFKILDENSDAVKTTLESILQSGYFIGVKNDAFAMIQLLKLYVGLYHLSMYKQ